MRKVRSGVAVMSGGERWESCCIRGIVQSR